MRKLPTNLQNIVNAGGPFTGDNKPITILTVQPDWYLNLSSGPVGNREPFKLPIRYFQTAANDQTEIVIPNLQHCTIDRSLGEDAGTIQATFYNTATPALGQAGDLPDAFGQPGYLSYARGASFDAQQRWGQQPNQWANVLRENALIRCVDTQTEGLTRRGWLRYDEIRESDEMLGIDPDTGVAVWQVVDEVFRKEYVGLLTRIRTRSHDSLTTANHRWLTRTRAGRLTWKTTETLTTDSGIPLAAPVDLPELPTYSDDLVELAAWYFTEGSHEHRLRSLDWGVKISQSHVVNAAKTDRIREVARRLFGDPGRLPRGVFVSQSRIDAILAMAAEGHSVAWIAEALGEKAGSVRRWVTGQRNTVKHHKWDERVRRLGARGEFTDFVFSQEVGRELTALVCGADKVPSPEFLLSLTLDQLRLFVDVCILGDGTVDRGARSFIQAHPDRTGAFEMACVLAGLPIHTVLSLKGHADKVTLLSCDTTRPLSAVACTKSSNASDASKPGIGSRAYGVTQEHYDGVVWCPRVKHGNWLARRNGSVFFTGNTYQGYGPSTMSLPDLITNGYVVLNGMFLVDNVAIQAHSGTMTLNGRDMAKLLIEQVVWPETVPQAFYGYVGVQYFITGQNRVAPVPGYGTGSYITGRCVFDSASTTSPVDGHNVTDCLDGNPATYYLSEGFSTSTGTPWIEFDTQEQISSVFLVPYGGNFTCYVSVFVNGAWVAGPGSVNGIAYVTQFGVPGGVGAWHDLPARYNASKFRLTFSNLMHTGATPPYRAGLVEVQVGGSAKVTVSDLEALDIAVTHTGAGYRICGSDGSVTCYGDAMDYGNRAGQPLNGAIVGISTSLSGDGYTLLGADGGIFTYGDGVFYGSAGSITLSQPAVALNATPTGLGYWICAADGGVFNFGDATFYGAQTGGGDGTGIVDMAVRPQGDGYWQVTNSGDVYQFGSAAYYGGLGTLPHPNPVDNGEHAAGIESTQDGLGYWIVTVKGNVYGFGSATAYGGVGNITLNAPVSGIRRTFDGLGYYLVAADGGVFNFGDAQFWGALPGVGIVKGTYSDYADIVEDMCLWAGFWLKPTANTPANQPPAVFGNIEKTNAWNAVGPLDPSTTDKKQLIDVIKMIKDVVGYYFRVDETGAVRFSSPNYWSSGNFLDDGTPIQFWPILDEKLNVTDYVQTTSDQSLLSEIIVSAADPYKYGGAPAGLTVTRFVPPNIGSLHGIQKPGMIGVPLNVPITQQDQEIMAELLALQCFFANRQGQVSAAVNPAICPDDQIRIYERQSGEANIHYVKGVHTEHDLKAGTWIATYTTYWLGNSDVWSITTNPASVSQQLGGTGNLYSESFPLTGQALTFLTNTGSPSTQGLASSSAISPIIQAAISHVQ